MKKTVTLLLLLPILAMLGNGTIDLTMLFNYANQIVPGYINEDNTPNNNQISDEIATLGRVLFYDTNLSLDNSISCASCHKQEFAFGDDRVQSEGFEGGLTGRHSMRLVNARFADERRFFWDERANSLEQQSTMPIQDHIEMGFSGSDGQPTIDSLMRKLSNTDYYPRLFEFAFDNQVINEQRVQRALAQFIRSIQSFDSKFDAGLAQANNLNAQFPNFTDQENLGKTLFLSNNGAACQRCHNAPEFDIDDNSDNNGIIGVIGDPTAVDLNNTRSPSLRDLFGPDGSLNGPLMHTGEFQTIREVIDHYDDIPVDPLNDNLDNRLVRNNGTGQNLNLNENEKLALEAFLRTLTGSDIYTNEKWSNPFDENGNILILDGSEMVDLDGDGFDESVDCDDENASINPGQSEIPYNGLDDDCNDATLDDDLDQDGFAFANDCDDNNPDINPNQIEIPYNGLDDDCNVSTLDDDLDQDGFAVADDCDDSSASINPNQVEIPYNGLDDDCNDATLDDDLDQDGFGVVEDCDDSNVNIGPAQIEIPYNFIDDDCDPNTLDDDLDGDGYGVDEDCDDSDAGINPAAEEIAGNGIDEDCDGDDLSTSIHELSDETINVYPNPAVDVINVEALSDESNNNSFNLNLYDLRGSLIISESAKSSLDVSNLTVGTYLLKVEDIESGDFIVEKIIIGL